MLRKLLCMVLQILPNVEYDLHRDIRSAHHAMHDFRLNHSREIVEITYSVIITTVSSIQ